MKRHLLICSILILVSLFLATPVLAQVAKIVVEGVPDRFKSANAGQRTTSLTNVAAGTRVVLSAWIYSGTGTKTSDTLVGVTSATWTITAPAGSTAAIADTTTGGTSKIIVYFVADSVGTYTITMTPTPISGTAPSAVSITIHAAKFVGVGISAPTAANGAPATCATCHQGSLAQNFIDWTQTNHAQAVKRKMNEVGGHFNTYCLACHSVGYDGLTTHNNDGFDDRALIEGFPASIVDTVGTWDSLVVKYPKTMATTGITCENCHGPASEHMKTGDKTLLDASLSADVCSPCHFSSDRHGIGFAWSASAHAKSTFEGAVAYQYTDRFTCGRCHTAQGYINVVIGGQVLPNNANSVVSYPNAMPITCQACHDPHKNNNPGRIVNGAYTYPQLRASDIGEVCVGCHITRISSRGLHSAHQGSMLIGHNATPMTLAKIEAYRAPGGSSVLANNVGLWAGWELPGYKYENSTHSSIQERCVQCHMAQSPSFIAASKRNFSPGDSLIQKVGGHTFRVAYEIDSTHAYLNPTGCVECHGEGTTIEFVDLTQAKTQALLTTLLSLLPKRDTLVTTAYADGAPISPVDTVTYQGTHPSRFTHRALTTLERAAAYNYVFVKNDLSFGVHNFNYAKGLLTSSIEQLQLGAGAAAIAQIKDVPGDNGKQVQVVWNKFPAEAASYNRLISYGIWRQDPLLPASGIPYQTASSFTEMIKNGTVGSQFAMAGLVWTYVATVPAANLAQYAYIAPTVFDSTKTGGMKYTSFYISGHTADPTYVYKSAVDSGYSLNNLFPLAPSGIAASSNGQGVTIKWDQPSQRDNDVVQYEVFRGTTANFTPTSPIATVNLVNLYLDANVTTGTMYYYKVRAIDNAGNTGDFSVEISLKATSVEQLTGIPTEFSLGQNYPNPFNPSTQIRFGIPNQAFVKLMIYNVSGELVRTLVNTEMSAGFYGVTWNGMNSDGQSVSTGVYIYRVQAGSFVSSKKMLLLK